MTRTAHAAYFVTNKVNIKYQVSPMSIEYREKDMT